MILYIAHQWLYVKICDLIREFLWDCEFNEELVELLYIEKEINDNLKERIKKMREKSHERINDISKQWDKHLNQ
jgi:hypothetical protein